MGFGLECHVVFILATIGGRQSLIFFQVMGGPTREEERTDRMIN